MIIRIIASGRSIEIDDPRNFRAFSIRIEGSMDAVLQDQLLRGIAVSGDGEHAWISEKALREWPSLKSEAWWQEGLSNMMAAVQKFGWIDQASQSIRAHIEYAPSEPASRLRQDCVPARAFGPAVWTTTRNRQRLSWRRFRRH